MGHATFGPRCFPARSAILFGVAGAAIALGAGQAQAAIWSGRDDVRRPIFERLERDVADATKQKSAPAPSRPAPARPVQGQQGRQGQQVLQGQHPLVQIPGQQQPPREHGIIVGGAGTSGGGVRTVYHAIKPPVAGRAPSPDYTRAVRHNDGWAERAHYPARRDFNPVVHFMGNPARWRDHFEYLPPQPFYQADMAAFVAFVPVPVGELDVEQVADAAPEDACVNRGAAQDVQSGNFYADGPPTAPPPGAPPVAGPGAVVCSNQVAINGVTQDQTEAAAAQLANAAAQGQNSGTLTLQDDKGRTQQVTYRVEDSYTGVAEVDMPLLDGVEAPASGANIPRNPFRAVAVQSRLRVRSSPSEQVGKITGEYDPGQIVQIQAITPDGNWALVAYGGFGVGYVSMRYLAPAPTGTTALAVARPQRPTQVAVAPTPKRRDRRPSASASAETKPASTTPAKFNVYKVHALAPCQTFVIDQKMRNQACSFGGTMAYNSDVPKLENGG